MQTGKELAHCVQTHAALEAKRIERGHHEACQPLPAFFRLPQPGLRMAVAALHRVLKAMDTALGQPGLMGKMANALGSVGTKTVENPKTFRPKSHVGPVL